MIDFHSNTVQVHVIKKDKDDNWLHLILQRSNHEKVYPNVWQVVTGTVEENETAWQTALREVWEETGIIPERIWTLPYTAMFFNPYKNSISAAPVFVFQCASGQEVQLSEEHQNFKWLTHLEAIDNLVIPSHAEGTKLLQQYICDNENSYLFELNTDWKNFLNHINHK